MAVFGAFTFILFTFYFSANAPQLRNWIAQLLTVAMMPALFEIYADKYELIPELAPAPGQPAPVARPQRQRRSQRHTSWLRHLLHLGS